LLRHFKSFILSCPSFSLTSPASASWQRAGAPARRRRHHGEPCIGDPTGVPARRRLLVVLSHRPWQAPPHASGVKRFLLLGSTRSFARPRCRTATSKVELPQANKLWREEGHAVECSAGLLCLPSRTQMSGAQPAPRRRTIDLQARVGVVLSAAMPMYSVGNLFDEMPVKTMQLLTPAFCAY
ncbi:unnamed protein product, partial [Urochloa humidicola]